MWTAEPPISSSVTSSPTAAFTRWRPPSAIDDVPFTIGTKSASAGMYAVPAAQWPSIAATIGTTPLIATCSRNRSPAPGERRAARRLDARAGRVEQPDHRDALAQRELRAAGAILFSPTAPIEPAITVKSYAATATAPAVDLADAGDRAVGREVAVAEPGVHVVGEHPVLDPRAGIEQQVEPLADGELAERALPLDALGAAHAERALARACEVADERPPVVDVAASGRGHGVTPRTASSCQFARHALELVSAAILELDAPTRRRGHGPCT